MYQCENYSHWQNVLVQQVPTLIECISVTCTVTDRIYQCEKYSDWQNVLVQQVPALIERVSVTSTVTDRMC